MSRYSRPTGQNVGRDAEDAPRRERRNHASKVGFLGRVAFTGAALVGVAVIANSIGNATFGWHFPGFGSTLPSASGSVLKDSWSKQKETLPICPDVVGVDVGVLSHNRVLGISGFKADHLYPVTYSKCGKGVISTMVRKHYDSQGVIDQVSTNMPNYQPVNPAINFNNGQVLCMSLSSTATMGEVIAAAKTYNHEKKQNVNIQCDWGQATTGAGFAGEKDPANNTYVSLQAAQNTAVLAPLPPKIEQGVARDIIDQAKAQLHDEYPTASTINVTYQNLSPVQQIESNWLAQESNITNGVKSVNFSNSGGVTEANYISRYLGMESHVAIDTYIPDNEITGLNEYVHGSHDYTYSQ